MADSKGNYYKNAGLKEGDEVKALNGKHYKNFTYKEQDDFEKQDTLMYDIVRKGKPLRIKVVVNKSEIQGD